ncbi:MAG: amidase family protein [Alphaproteobacteria bacterium]|nr:amidase family protein [Alphaproteobacteria bacterium]
MADPILFLSIAEVTDRFRRGDLTPGALVEHHIARIAEVEPRLAAFQVVDAAGARAMAAAADGRWRAGRPLSPLDGVPMTIKDNVDVAGHPTRNGSLLSSDAPAEGDAPVVARLREAGAVFLGKTTTPEFGWKGVTDSRLRGARTRNPWDTGRSPGGSSGGAAAALAAGVGTIAFGNDGGGSIRIPAAFSGVFGIKPNFGRVPHSPLEGFFATVVSGGPLTRSVADAATALAVMARPDDRDWYALPPPAEGWLDGLRPRLAGLRLAYAPLLGGAVPDEAVRPVVEAALGRIASTGAVVEEVGPVIMHLRPAFEAFWRASFGVRLNTYPREQWDLIDPGYVAVAEQGLGIGVEPVLAGEKERARLHRELAVAFREFDLLVTPTTPHVAPSIEAEYNTQGYDRWHDGVPYTLPFNLTGHPAASIPCGLTAEGLPVGLQVVGPKYSERAVLEACLAIEGLLGFNALREARMMAF